MERKVQGFSLVELLVCVAIISILMAMYLPALSKARKRAEAVVVKEGLHQEVIGGYGDAKSTAYRYASFSGSDNDLRVQARAAFRCKLTMTGGDTLVTRMIAQVKNENEFRAYWQTLVNPAASGTIEHSNSGITVRDDAGNAYELPYLGDLPISGATFPAAWEFLSTDLSEGTAGTLGVNVLFSDGHVDYVPYPGAYPACRSVAELSHRFMSEAP